MLNDKCITYEEITYWRCSAFPERTCVSQCSGVYWWQKLVLEAMWRAAYLCSSSLKRLRAAWVWLLSDFLRLSKSLGAYLAVEFSWDLAFFFFLIFLIAIFWVVIPVILFSEGQFWSFREFWKCAQGIEFPLWLPSMQICRHWWATEITASTPWALAMPWLLFLSFASLLFF